MQRLATGLRINSARDDAAGLAISQSMTSQIRGLNQAVRNINDGVNLLQTAEGGLGSITDMLQRMRELAVQSANGTNSDAQRAYLQKEAAALQEQIGKVVDTTTWNDKKLLDGSFTGQKIQVGAESGATMDLTIPSAISIASTTNSITTVSATQKAGGVVGSTALAAGDLTINSAPIGAAASASAKDVAAAINLQTGTTGVTATARPTLAASAAPIGQVAATISLGAKGNLIAPVTVNGGQTYYFWDKNDNGSVSDDAVMSYGQLSNNWTDVSGSSGELSATHRYTSINGVSVAIPLSGFGGGYSGFIHGTSVGSLTPSNGSNQVNPTYDGLAAIWDAYNGAISAGQAQMSTQYHGDWYRIDSSNVNGTPPGWMEGTYLSADQYFGVSGTSRTTLNMSIGQILYTNGYDATFIALQVLNPTTSFSTIASNDIQINGVNIGEVPIAANSSVRSAQMVTAINAQITNTGVSASVDANTGGVTLTATDGRNIEISTLTSAAITSDKIGIAVNGTALGNRTVTTYRSGIDLNSSSSAGITVTANALGSTATGLTSGTVAATINTVTTTTTTTTPSIDISTAAGASSAIGVIDSTLDSVNSTRSTIGSATFVL